MFNIFKKNIPKSIELVVHPTIPKDQINNFVNSIIVPTNNSLPNWWKTQKTNLFNKVDKIDNYVDSKGGYGLNTNHCPAFIDLFKNSYVIKSPCDWYLETHPEKGWKFRSANDELLTAIEHNIVQQMNFFADGYIVNFKLSFGVNIRSNPGSGLIKLVFLQPYYHNPHMPLTVMPGVLPLIPKLITNLNLNFSFDKRKPIKYACKKGDVIGILYSTDKKLPKLKITQSPSYGGGQYWGQTKFTGSYIDKLKEYKI